MYGAALRIRSLADMTDRGTVRFFQATNEMGTTAGSARLAAATAPGGSTLSCLDAVPITHAHL